MKDRIVQIIEKEGLTPSKFAEIIEVQRSNISHILAGRNKPSLDFLQKIMAAFPHISGDWLLTGSGTMDKGGDTNKDVTSNNHQADLFSVNSSPPARYETIKHEDENTEKEDKLISSSISDKKIKKIIVIYDDFGMDEFVLRKP